MSRPRSWRARISQMLPCLRVCGDGDARPAAAWSHPRAGRQVHFASLRAARRARRRPVAPDELCTGRRLPIDALLSAGARRGDPPGGRRRHYTWDEVSTVGVHRPRPLDAGNSGTTMRMLAGLLAGQPFTATLVGDESLSRRPMRRVIEPLTRMGARIESADGHAPLTVHWRTTARNCLRAGRPERPGEERGPARRPSGDRDDVGHRTGADARPHRARIRRVRGRPCSRPGSTVSVQGGQRIEPRELTVPGDFSSAAFWMVAAAALPGSQVVIEDVGLNPTRTGLVDVLRRFGARVETRADEHASPASRAERSPSKPTARVPSRYRRRKCRG